MTMNHVALPRFHSVGSEESWGARSLHSIYLFKGCQGYLFNVLKQSSIDFYDICEVLDDVLSS